MQLNSILNVGNNYRRGLYGAGRATDIRVNKYLTKQGWALPITGPFLA